MSILILALLPLKGGSTQQEVEKPLPDLAQFLQGVRGHLRSDRLLLRRSEVPLRFPAWAVGGFHVCGRFLDQVRALAGNVDLLSRVVGKVIQLGP